MIEKKDHYRVLVLHGGGVGGVITARILQELEEKSGKHTTELFDYIIGTSIGGIIAAGLTTPDEHDKTKPKYTAEDVVNIILDRASDIFSDSNTSNTWLVWLEKKYSAKTNYLSEKYSRDGIDTVLKDILGDSTLSQTIKPITVVSYSLDKDKPRTWSSLKAFKDKFDDHYIKDAAGATSAAPTFFPPKITQVPNKEDYHDIDGGIFANSATLIGTGLFLKSLDNEVNNKDITVVSVGTGWTRKNEKVPKGGGKISWARNDIVEKMMRASEFSDITSSLNLFKNYIILNPYLSKNKAYELDDVEKMTQLKEYAEEYAEKKKIEYVASCLTEDRKDRFEYCEIAVSDNALHWRQSSMGDIVTSEGSYNFYDF